VPETNATDADVRDAADPRLASFGMVADQIVRQLAPARVLDAGCAKGFLVQQLRARGVEAFGIDISEYAISEVDDEVQDHCLVASLTNPIEGFYDLVTCFDVLEHMPPVDARVALDNLCRTTGRILLSSGPVVGAGPVDLDGRLPEQWAANLEDNGFSREPSHGAPHALPGAALYVRAPVPFVTSSPPPRRVPWRIVSSPNAMTSTERTSDAHRSQGRPYDALLHLLSPKSILVIGHPVDRTPLLDELGDRRAEVHEIDADLITHARRTDRDPSERYDLTIWVASPGLALDDAAHLVRAIAAATDVVLLVQTATAGSADRTATGHTADWSRLLADQGLFRAAADHVGDVPRSAVMYRRSQPSVAELVHLYERALHALAVDAEARLELLDADRLQLRKEILRVRDLAFGRQAELASASARVEELDALLARYDNLEHRLKDVLDSRSWRMTQTIGIPLRRLRGLR